MTNIGNCETSNQPMTPPGASDRVSMVCFMHDTRHINLKESITLTNPNVKHFMMSSIPSLTNPDTVDPRY